MHRVGGDVTNPLHIALIGTRGVPAAYGGFETAVEEIGRRLVGKGHRVTVYCRDKGGAGRDYLGMTRVVLPAVRRKALETLSHTALSVAHSARDRPDVAIVFNAANSPFLPVLRTFRVPVALHMDGLEWRRSKWGGAGKRFYRGAELFGVRTADALIADSPGIADYYRHQFDARTELIAYGAPQLRSADPAGVENLDLRPNGYHLAVARFEPENHVREIVAGYAKSSATKPLAVVGSAPYSEGYIKEIRQLAQKDSRIRLLGAVYDQKLLDSLYFHAYAYIHGHSVGGTNPSLLRAIGAGTAVIAYDVSFNRAVIEGRGWFFRTEDEVASAVLAAEGAAEQVSREGAYLREHASRRYTWDSVAVQYENLAYRLHGGETMRPSHKRATRNPVAWDE
ncbi:DUF1972 domain-containing protein [Gordonia hongkongensis]|uniref:DUF1972 domain-containing protein n=1 Tax=Gordonia hongkongensis TaxID=1701090 RepID=A0AAX3T9M7_9ACTN|nr:DUF1972 domain-containing protein [Gordonia hongkongensis]QIK49165.1 glycosyltransferase family 1 protein [Gordonia terrae]WFP25926.1 DUF1972 domain-containing protein [Gordonia hongkongensis]